MHENILTGGTLGGARYAGQATQGTVMDHQRAMNQAGPPPRLDQLLEELSHAVAQAMIMANTCEQIADRVLGQIPATPSPQTNEKSCASSSIGRLEECMAALRGQQNRVLTAIDRLQTI